MAKLKQIYVVVNNTLLKVTVKFLIFDGIRLSRGISSRIPWILHNTIGNQFL